MGRRGIAFWGGIECTVNRVGDAYFDQVRRTGHHDRLEDLDRIASLGVTAVRYPVLWERVAPNGLHLADWSWTDERLDRLRMLGIEPILTLLHHGSGPRYATLLDDDFPAEFAAFAGQVARRYPWVTKYTPVNEPLTTARFTCLYGHWHPHRRDDASFVSALLNQCRATARAMDAIREVNAGAELVQTEDLGKVHATAPLAYQAQFENERRWLSLDLLFGRFAENGAMSRYFQRLGLSPDAKAYADCLSPPDIVGFNYYVTSERFLDHRVALYPERCHGANGIDSYADVEAVRARPEELDGFAVLAREGARRYDCAIAVTEAQLCGEHGEQLRWVDELYHETAALYACGIDVRAFTLWSLFGAYDWNRLVTAEQGDYENGCFDVAGPGVCETPLAHWARAHANGDAYDHHALRRPGWWRHESRLLYGAAHENAETVVKVS